jgi:DNA modification methylase
MMGHIELVHGSGARMDRLGDGEADMVFAGPPYWPVDLEAALHAPRSHQAAHDRVSGELYAHARAQRPVIAEAARILRRGGAMVIQTKDIRYGGMLVAIPDTHLACAEGCGLRLVARVVWLPKASSPWRRPRFVSTHRVGDFTTADGEVFLVLAHACGLERRGPVQGSRLAARELAMPVWRMPSRRRAEDHRHASPRPVVRELVALLTEPGDLVVDPYAGGGTALEVAASMGRRAIGYEIDGGTLAETRLRLGLHT